MAWQRIFISLVLAASMAGGAAAESVGELLALVPSCAVPCLTKAVIGGGCSLTNVTLLANCMCTNVTLLSDLSTCVQTSTCTFQEQVDAGNMRGSLCDPYPKESRVNEVRAMGIAAVAVSTVVVGARCTARVMRTGRLWSDDWTAIIATLMLLAGSGLELRGAQLGFGLHFWDIDSNNATVMLQLFYVLELFYTWIKLIAKASIVLMYMRIFTGPKFRWACYACLGYCVMSLLAFTFALAFQCKPVESIWNRYITGQCLDVNAIGFTGAILSIVEDVVLMVLPIPELRKLKISGRKRIAVGLMFALASFAAVTSMIRLKHLVQFSKSYDTSYENVDTIIWSFLELTCIIVCGSLPPLRPWFTKLVPSMSTLKRSSRRAKGSKGSSNGREDGPSELTDISMPQRSKQRHGDNGAYDRMESGRTSVDEYPLKPTAADGPWTGYAV